MADLDFGAAMDGYIAKKTEQLDSGVGTFMDAYIKNKDRQFLGQVNQAVDVNPDKYAGDKKTAQMLGRPTVAVEALPQDSARQAKVKTIENDTANAPVLRRQYTDADFAKLAHDDSGPLSAMETLIGALKYVVSAPGEKNTFLGDVGAGFYRANRGAAGVFQAGAELGAAAINPLVGRILPENPLARVADYFARTGAASERSAKERSPSQSGIIAPGVSSGVQSLVQNTLMLPMALLPGGQVAALSGMAGLTAGQSYQEAREKGVPMGTALPFAVSQGLIEYVTEVRPLQWLIGDITSNATLRQTLVHQLKSEIPGEQLATVLQDMNEWAILHPEKTFKDYLAERPTAAAQTLVATIVGVGGNVALGNALDSVMTSQAEQQQRKQIAEQQRQVFGMIDTLTAQSKLKARDQEVFQRFVNEAAPEGAENVYISANVLMQSGVAEQLAQTLPSVAEQLPEALAADGYVRIPMGEYAAKIAGTELNQSIIDHVKVDPNRETFAESQEYAKAFDQEMQVSLERKMLEHEADATFKASRDAVRDEFLGQLNQVKQFTPDVNNAYATMLANFYAVTAAKIGITPQELVSRYKLNVTSHLQGRGAIEQFPPGSEPIPLDEAIIEHGRMAENMLDAERALSDGEQIFVAHDMAQEEPMRVTNVEELKNFTHDQIVIVPSGINIDYSGALDQAAVAGRSARSTQSSPIPATVASASDINAVRQIASSTKWSTNRDFKLAIQAAVQSAAGRLDLRKDTPELRAYLVQQILKEAREALVTNANAVGWYDEKVTTALEVVSEIHPELKHDEQSRFAFIWALAVTSNGVMVNKNFELAERAYTSWKSSGADAASRRMPTANIGVGTAASKIHEGLALYNRLIGHWGFDRLRSFATTLQPNRQVAQTFGRKVSGEGMDTMVYGAGVLGPKIGNGFFMNLFGEFGQLTMDRWWVRMWGRLTGDLVEIDPAKIRESRAAFLSLIDMIKTDKAATRAVEQAIGARLGKSNPTEMARTIVAKTAKKEVRDALAEILPATPEREAAVLKTRGKVKDFVSVADELRKAAKAFHGNLDGQIEVPGGSRRRNMMRAVSQSVLAELQKDHPHLTMADFQALMWYPEKTLYDSAGAQKDETEDGYEDDEAPDYANAAVSLAREQGVSDDRINAAIERARSEIASRQRAGRGGRGSGSVSAQAGYGAGETAPGGQTLDQSAYHGSPHQVGNFSTDYIGTGDALNQTPFEGSEVATTPVAEGITEIEVDGVMRPALNNEGRVIHWSEEGIRNFWRWFGDSKVVDDQGRPLVVYHGTGASFDTFRPSKAWGNTFFFAADQWYADKISATKGGASKAVYVSVQSPRVIDAKDYSGLASLEGLDRGAMDGVIILSRDGQPNTVVAFSPNQIKSAIGNRGTFDPQSANILHQSAYHGSPHRGIEQFSTDYIGTGEGAQAYGWGLYFASMRGVAEYYRETLGDWGFDYATPEAEQALRAATNFADGAWAGLRSALTYAGGDAKKAAGILASQYQSGTKDENMRAAYRLMAQMLREGSLLPKHVGQLYEVDIPEDSDMLDWNKPLSEQSNPSLIKDIADDLDLGGYQNAALRQGKTGEDFYNAISSELGGDKKASQYLASWGIKGIKYLGESSHNYVVFSGDDVAIRNQFYQPTAAGPRGQILFGNDITQQPSIISLLKRADLSTFIHEAGHFFLQVQMDLAARIQAGINEGEIVTPGERSIVDDANKLLEWFGVQATADASALQVWHRMTLEQQTKYHEKFARGFEAYSFEGRSPTLEMQTIFQRFSAWLVNIYKELKALNVTLTDEVRGVMDRMLATREQIEAAEAARNLGPLFNPQNAKGIIEDWKAYHALANDATQAAIDELQPKSLSEMQWLSNARSRALKELQKRHDELRREMRIEVTREVMSRPEYLAWRFLTGKLEEEDKIAPPERIKSHPDRVNPEVDSLLVAIAKLGGISRDSAAKLGVNPDEFNYPSGVFGKPVFRKEGGRTADSMGEVLTELGYLPQDEHGKHDKNDLEDRIADELGGRQRYSVYYNPGIALYEQRAGEGQQPEKRGAGRLSLDALRSMGYQAAVIDALKARRMTARDGFHPDVLAEGMAEWGYDSGDALVQAMITVPAPKDVINALTDERMLESHGELVTPEARERAADAAVHNQLRAKMLHAEATALEKAMNVRAETGKTDRRGRPQTYAVLPEAARAFARRIIGKLKVRDIRPSQYAAAETKAAKEAERAFGKGNLERAAEQKRAQILNHYTTQRAYQAQDEVRRTIAYLRKFAKRSKGIDPDYYDQIAQILERFDLVPSTSLKAIDKRTALAAWLAAQEEQGIVPDIPPELIAEANRKSYKDMTVDELAALRDTIQQIEHLGRLKQKLLNAKDQREFAAIRDEITESIAKNARGRHVENRTPNTVLGEKLAALKNFWASHIKAATWARIMDGGKDGGPMWEHLIRTANERGDWEVERRAKATRELSALLAPVLGQGKLGGKGVYFKSINRSMNKESILAMALNMGNASNMQRLLGGEGWTLEQIKPVLDTLTTADWNFVQSVWDYFESYRPEIGAKEKRIYGKEPAWIEAMPLTVQTRDGDTLNLRGGYYPVKYDPRASVRAEQHQDAEAAQRMLQGAYTSATTKRSFTKERVDEVEGRPLLYSLDGIYGGVNEVIHDLAWHEWLIDSNRIIKNPKIAEAIREHYGADVYAQFKNWIKDIAEGDRGAQDAGEKALAWVRQGVSITGLGINVMSALMQPFGITQSWARIGSKWIGRGVAKTIADPFGIAQEISEKSSFMRNRSLTRMRELAELRSQVKGQTKVRANVDASAYWLMLRAQQLVDVPTWWGAYEKATAEGNAEDRAVALADQAVIDAQGSGTTKDLAAIERGGPFKKLFTTFYSFANTSLNLGVAQTMTSQSKAKLAADYLMIYTVPVILIGLMKAAFTPGDSGDWDDPEKAAWHLIKMQINYLMGLFFGIREIAGIADAVEGKPQGDYSGPAGLRLIPDTLKLAKQLGQGEMDDGLRKALINVSAELFRLPGAQVNRSITGTQAFIDGDTDNPLAVIFGYERPH